MSADPAVERTEGIPREVGVIREPNRLHAPVVVRAAAREGRRNMAYWLKVAGSGDDPFIHADWRRRHDEWKRKLGSVTAFPRTRRPSGIRTGDILIMYAAGSAHNFGEGRIFAAEEVLSDEPELGRHERWVWTLPTRLIIAGPLLSEAPTLSDIDVDSKSVRRQSHIRLDDDQGHRAERLLREASKGRG